MSSDQTASRSTPHGSWRSPISASKAAAAAGRIAEPSIDRSILYWLERRPEEGGRNALVRALRTASGWHTEDLLGPEWNVRTRTHEYGGGSYHVSGGHLFFVHFGDQRIYQMGVDGEPEIATPEALTAIDETKTYADPVLDSDRKRLLCVQEDHSGEGEPRNTLVAVGLDGEIVELVAGADFFSSPRLSPDGRTLAWLSWRHPNMPWDSTTLWCSPLDASGFPSQPRVVAGGDGESIFQPVWGPEGTLCFVSDRSGFWNLYRKSHDGAIEPLAPREAEFGLPQWVFRMSTYAVPTAQKLACTWCEEGIWHLGTLFDGKLRETQTPYTVFEGFASESTSGTSPRVVLLGASPSQGTTVLQWDLGSGVLEEVHRLSTETPDPATLSVGEPIRFPTRDGSLAHAFYYPPRNDAHSAPADDLPPLLVKSHGGPTALATNDYQIGIQFWTSRGFAVVDVNYGGSTGFGRAYRERLDGQWGIVDVDDCVAAAQFLVDQKRADPKRLAIRGGSAGGYTTLAALAFRDTFSAGASHYGVGDLEMLVRDTHKFEARYLDRLVGPYPERSDLYRERSPIHATEGLSCPVVFFQGLEDKVVPPNQAEAMVTALRSGGIPVAYVAFEGEQHGFRKAENIARALEAELYFYSRVMGFELADPIEPIEILNLD